MEEYKDLFEKLEAAEKQEKITPPNGYETNEEIALCEEVRKLAEIIKETNEQDYYYFTEV